MDFSFVAGARAQVVRVLLVTWKPLNHSITLWIWTEWKHFLILRTQR